MKDQTEKRVSIPQRIIFGSGDLFGGGGTIILTFFYAIYLTDVAKINPIYAGLIVLVSKVWDAVSDPLMGMISDRTRTRIGRRKPYFILGFFLIIISFILLWYPVPFQSELSRFIFVLSGYLLYSTVITMVMVPYSAMVPELSPHYNERTSIMSVRLAFSFFATLLCAVVPMEIIKVVKQSGQPESHGYLIMAIIFSIIFAVPFLFITLFVKEERDLSTIKVEKFKIKSFLKPLKIKAFRQMSGIYIFTFLALDIQSTLIPYFMKYYLNPMDRSSAYIDINQLSLLLGTMVFVQLLFLPFYSMLARKMGKNRAFIVAALIWLSGLAALSFAHPQWPEYSYYLIAALIGAGASGAIMLPWSMFPDTTDVGELATGERIEGSFSGIMTFSRKVASAVAIFIVMTLLGWQGYLNPDKKIKEMEKITAALQTNGIITNAEANAVTSVNELITNKNIPPEALRTKGDPFTRIVPEKVDRPYRELVEMRNSAMQKVAGFQASGVITMIRLLIIIAPFLLLGIAVLIARKYSLTAPIHAKLSAYLTSLRMDSKYGSLSEEEVNEMKKTLIG